MRILIIAHGHPDINVGGGEKAAYILFNRFRETDGIEAFFLARAADAPDSRGSHVSAYPGRVNEYFLHTSMADYFNMSADRPEILNSFREFLKVVRPDVIHFHHYIHMGVELLKVARDTCPEAPLLMTLHEYIALCNREGQMIKTVTNKLCYESNHLDCSMCFPDRQPTDFFLRDNYIKRFFGEVDAFVVPSRFLRDRYIKWGIPEEKFVFMPYGAELKTLPKLTAAEKSAEEKCNVFGFFGQINNYKGLDVLISAIAYMSKKERRGLHLEVFGNLSVGLSDDRRALIENAFIEHKATVRFNGPYQSIDLPRLIRRVDWVVTPSVWWENAPLVIDEAFASGKPVICSNIGGMAEKVRHGIDGLHFEVGNHRSLARTMVAASGDFGQYVGLKSNIAPPYDISTVAEQHRDLYGYIKSGGRNFNRFNMSGQSDHSGKEKIGAPDS